jgi:glycosyltransferase involved in cell wall biosynthesis
MVFDNVAFERVGYFDESFGQYGMEHVDWSNRVSLSGIQPAGFHDVIGSNGFFRVHSDASAVESRASHLVEARRHYESIKNNSQRIYIAPTARSEVPKLSYIIPFRGQDRFDAIRVTLLNIKAQRFPCLEIIMVEQDSSGFVNFPEFAGVRKILAQSSGPFNKALAFNSGIANTTGKLLVLHDADIMAGADYSQTVYYLLENYDSFHIGKRVLYLDHNSTTKMALQMKLTGDLAIERCVGYFEGGSLGCHFNTYLKIGGFCEEFVGYGNEDCEFYSRLTQNSKFYGERTVDFVHLWHGRTSGWKDHHEKNKKLESQLCSMPMEQRLKRVNNVLSKYGMRPR